MIACPWGLAGNPSLYGRLLLAGVSLLWFLPVCRCRLFLGFSLGGMAALR